MERRNTREAMSEAANRSLDFDPKVRATFVRFNIDKVEKLLEEGKTVDEIKALCPDFSDRYKNLFEMLTQPGGYNQQSLKTMLAMLDRMGNGELTQHQASVIVGQRLANAYIKPDELPRSSSAP